MADWQTLLGQARGFTRRVPPMLWVGGAVVAASLGVALWLETAGPAYVVLDDGLSPADGGKVIAQLQKLNIPYELQGAGNLILVPAPELARARLELGAADVPGTDVGTAWQKLEDAPMTASTLAQSAMAAQALEASLRSSIEGMSGIRAAQVFLALPPDTPFLADQPKPTASVVISADEQLARAQAPAIASLVAGAVPGLDAAQVNVATNHGVQLYPVAGQMVASTQLALKSEIEAEAAARVAALLIPLVGTGNFQTDVSAQVDFTHQRTHRVSYGPGHLVTHQVSATSSQTGSGNIAIGIPGALSNEPPPATAAVPPQQAGASPSGQTAAPGAPATPPLPQQASTNMDETYTTDQSESDVTAPDWTVDSVAVSVVLNQAAMGTVTVAQVKAAVAGAFAYPNVNVNVLATKFQKPEAFSSVQASVADLGPLTQAGLELMAAAALLFGIAVPMGRNLSTLSLRQLTEAPRKLNIARPQADYADVKELADENIPGVARLLQNWAEEAE